MTKSKDTITWVVKVHGRLMAEFIETSGSMTKDEALEEAKKRFHPMPNLYVPGDEHPFEIEVFKKED